MLRETEISFAAYDSHTLELYRRIKEENAIYLFRYVFNLIINRFTRSVCVIHNF